MANQLKGFVALVVAMLTGDDAEVTALKIQKKAKASLRAQIAVKEAHTLTLEEKVETAQERLNNARINQGQVITDNDTYIRNLLEARASLSTAQENLDNHKDTIKFLKEELANVSK